MTILQPEDPKQVFMKLGATMYTPASHTELVSIGNGEKYRQLRSVVFCTEDSVHVECLESALANLQQALPLLGSLSETKIYRFVRVRNPEVMFRVLQMHGIQNIHGFVIPKATPSNLNSYLNLLSERDAFMVMPIIETLEAFRPALLRAMRKTLSCDKVRRRIPCVRIGGNDLLSLLDVRRATDRTIYQTFLQGTIIDIATTFKPYGFGVAAPVFECIEADETLLREVTSDLDHGLFGKTAIHPGQIKVIETQYAVTADELEMALAICHPNAAAVFKMHGRMCEVATHIGWAKTIIQRNEIYGLRHS